MPCSNKRTRRPVDVTQKEKEVEEKIEKGKEHPAMTRTSSRPAMERTPANATAPAGAAKASPASPKAAAANLAPTVRPTLSFAGAAAAKKAAAEQQGTSQETKASE